MKRVIVILAAASICIPALAGEKGGQEDWMKHVREKEMRRAKEAADFNGNIEHLEKKYGWLKEGNPEKFADMINKRKAAAKAWSEVASQVGSAKTPEEISVIKAPAYDAEASAELARLELKAAGAAKEWKHSAEKTGSDQVAGLADQLVKNQAAMLKARKEEMAIQKELRDLELERSMLDKQMRTAYEQARKAMHEEPGEKKK